MEYVIQRNTNHISLAAFNHRFENDYIDVKRRLSLCLEDAIDKVAARFGTGVREKHNYVHNLVAPTRELCSDDTRAISQATATGNQLGLSGREEGADGQGTVQAYSVCLESRILMRKQVA